MGTSLGWVVTVGAWANARRPLASGGLGNRRPDDAWLWCLLTAAAGRQQVDRHLAPVGTGGIGAHHHRCIRRRAQDRGGVGAGVEAGLESFSIVLRY
jgi:hypothetical protein